MLSGRVRGGVGKEVCKHFKEISEVGSGRQFFIIYFLYVLFKKQIPSICFLSILNHGEITFIRLKADLYFTDLV